MHSVLWRRLDNPGHDACRLEEAPGGWRIEGAAVFRENGVVVRLSYEVACDSRWRTREGRVAGALGTQTVRFEIERSGDGRWTANGQAQAGLQDCDDLDLGFTPATNLLQLRRLALRVTESADVPVAWLDAWGGTLSRLEQRYSRRGETTYWYEAARFGYNAMLEVDAAGFILRYPGLWEAERDDR